WTPCCSRSSRGSTCGSRCSEASPSSLRVGPGRVLRRQFASTTPPLLSPTVGHDLALLTWEAHVRRGRGTTDVGPCSRIPRAKGPTPKTCAFRLYEVVGVVKAVVGLRWVERRSCLYRLFGGRTRRDGRPAAGAQFQKGRHAARRKAAPPAAGLKGWLRVSMC